MCSEHVYNPKVTISCRSIERLIQVWRYIGISTENAFDGFFVTISCRSTERLIQVWRYIELSTENAFDDIFVTIP